MKTKLINYGCVSLGFKAKINVVMVLDGIPYIITYKTMKCHLVVVMKRSGPPYKRKMTYNRPELYCSRRTFNVL